MGMALQMSDCILNEKHFQTYLIKELEILLAHPFIMEYLTEFRI